MYLNIWKRNKMKLQVLSIFLFLGVLLSIDMNGQKSFDHYLNKYEAEDKPDSAYLIIDRFEKLYRANEQWDSLLYLKYQKCKLSFRYKGIDIVTEQLKDADLIAKQYGVDTSLIHLNYLNFKSDYYLDIRDYVQSEAILNEVIRIASTLKNDSTGQADNAIAEKSFLLLNLGRVKESEELASSVYENIVARGKTSQIIGVLQSLTMANSFLNRYDKAIEYNTENLKLIKASFGDSHPNVGLILSQMAEIYGNKGQVNKALEYYNKSKDIHYGNFKKSGSSRFLSNTIGNLGDFYSDIGESRLAIDHMTYSLDLEKAEYGEGSWRFMWHYSVLSSACRQYGDYDQADYYIDKAFDLIAKNDASTPYDFNLFSAKKAEMLYTRDNYEEALPMALKVYDFYEENEDFGSTNDRLHILNLITDIYRESGDFRNATVWSKKNIAYHNANSEPLSSIRINVLISYLTLLAEQKDTDEIYKIKDEILKLRNKGNDIYTLTNCIPEEELLYFASSWVDFLVNMSHENKKYESDYFQFLEEFEEYYKAHLATIKTNSNLANNEMFIKKIYGPAIGFLSDTNPEKSLLLLEKCKNFSTRQILQNQLIDDENLPTLEYSLEDSPDLSKDSIQIDVFFNVVAALDSVTAYKDSLYAADITKYEKYFGITELSIQDIKHLLRDDELLVEYFIHDTIVYAYYIDEHKVECRKHSAKHIERLASKVLDSGHDDSEVNLRKLLLPNELIDDKSRIRILSDGILNSISFEQLNYEERPLIYSKMVSYGLSASVLLHQQKLSERQEKRNLFLGLTPGFTKDFKIRTDSMYSDTDSSFYFLLQQPFLLSLSESLSRSFSGKNYKEEAATESVFKSQAQDYKILHIGTHGILNDQSPLFSKLIFAKDSLEDGYLHAYEIYGKNLNANLAVLSACSSGKEKTYASEGIVSLSHAFTHAGCPSILMTKWDVDEKSTSVILESFYKNIKKGMTKSEALREAKLSFLNTSPVELHDPYYWAGLVVIGDDSAMFTQAWYSSDLGKMLLGLIFFGLLYWLFIRKRKTKSAK